MAVRRCTLHALLIAAVLALCMVQQGNAQPASSYPKRVVVTLREYNACEVGGGISWECGVLAKCYGRRLVLNVGRCAFSRPEGDDGPHLKVVEEWVKDKLPEFEIVEEDAEFSSSAAKKARRQETHMATSLNQWNLQMLDVQNTWLTLQTYGENSVVAVLDSGIAETAVEAFQDRITGGYDFISDAELASDSNGRDAIYYDPGDADASCSSESSWHGTKVMSVLAANYSGFYGVAPGAKVLPVRVLGKCRTGFASDVADAIVWASGGHINGLDDLQGGSNVIVMAFVGLGKCPSFMQTAVDLAVSKGTVLYAAAGNYPNRNASEHFPANCNGVLSVGALTWKGEVARYSSMFADLYMPGGDADKTVPCLGSDLSSVQRCVGTSMAVSHAGGRYVLTGEKGGEEQVPGFVAGPVNSSVPNTVAGAGTIFATFTTNIVTNYKTNVVIGNEYWYEINTPSATSYSMTLDWILASNSLIYINDGTNMYQPFRQNNAGTNSVTISSSVLNYPKLFLGFTYYTNAVSGAYLTFSYTAVGPMPAPTPAPTPVPTPAPTTAPQTPMQVVAGDFHTCALMSDGTVKCWGQNTNGQIGDGTSGTDRLVPTATASLGGTATQITAGNALTCALMSDGTVKCWGYNINGQIGDGTSGTNRLVPTATASLGGTATQVAAGGSYACALLSDGTVKCWGGNFYGHLGDGTSGTNRLVPTATSSLGGTATQITAGSSHTCAIMSGGTVKCWGWNAYGQIGDGTSGTNRLVPTATSSLGGTAIQVAAGFFYTCALMSGGTVKCWGKNDSGQVGDGTSGTDRLVPTATASLGGIATRIATGRQHTCVIMSDGTVKCWGWNALGQIGDGTSGTNRLVPTATSSLGGIATQNAAGFGHVCALMSDGTVKCWGYNANGQIGDGTSGTDRLSAVTAIEVVIPCTAGTFGTGQPNCAVCPAGTYSTTRSASCTPCPAGTYSEVGGGTSNSSCTRCPAGYASSVVGANASSTCAICAAGAYALAGSANCTRCPAGSYSVDEGATSDATCIKCAAGYASNVVGASSSETCAICPAGSYAVAGAGTCTQCPAGSYSEEGEGATSAAVCIPCQEGTASAAAGAISATTCAVCPLRTYSLQGAAVCTSSLTGTQSVSQFGAMKGDHTCVITDVGVIKCWGYGANGQLGYESTSSRGNAVNSMGNFLPAVNLGTGISASQVVSGASHACALLDDSHVKCWGDASNGALGYESTTNRGNAINTMGSFLPVVNMGTGRTAKQIVAGSFHTCALLDDGNVKCWGYNLFGQLGYESTTNRGGAVNTMGNFLPNVNLGSGRTAKQIVAGSNHVCALLDDNNLKCWGTGGQGVLGYESTTSRGHAVNTMGNYLPNVNLGTGRTAKQIAAGSSHTCALLDDSNVKCWGYNLFGQLGYESSGNRGDVVNTMGNFLPNVNLGAGRTAKQIAAGSSHTCALLDNNSIKCWGIGSDGQLGYESTSNRGDVVNTMGNYLPSVNLGIGSTAKLIVAGPTHNCALLDNRNLKCWGSGANGRLGYESTVSRGHAVNTMGDYLPAVNLGTYSLCFPGLYKIAGGTCANCSAGSYSTTWNTISCTLCPAGTSSQIIGARENSTCTICPVGTYSDAGNATCTPCRTGTYAEVEGGAGSSSCQLCSAGYASPVLGSSSSSTCAICPAGQYSAVQGSTNCTLCPAAQYSVSPGSSTCELCSAGWETALAGSDSPDDCTICPAGSYSSPAGTQCVKCPMGSYSASLGESSPLCTGCPPGRFSAALGATSNQTCQSCTPGTYSNAPGTSSCLQCPAGTYSGEYGASNISTCLACPAGLSSLPGSPSLSRCNVVTAKSLLERKYPPTGLTKLSESFTTFYTYTTSVVSGQLYGNGQYAISSNVKDVNWYHDVMYAFDGLKTGYDTRLQEASYWGGTGQNYYSQASFLVSSDYKGDWISVKFPEKVKPLRVNMHLSTALNYRVYGMNSDNTGAGWTLLLDVVGAQYVNSEHISPDIPTTSTFDTIGIVVNRVSTHDWTIRELSFIIGQALPCESGQLDFGSASCISLCETGSYALAQTVNTSCATCPVGTFGPAGRAVCTQCPAGTYSQAQGATSNGTCLKCAAGYASNVVSAGTPSTCAICAAGKYADAQGTAVCTNCPMGSYLSTQGATSEAACELCPAGTASTVLGATSSAVCFGCNLATTYSTAGSPVCIPRAEISAGGSTHTCSKISNGKLYCWGEGADGRLGMKGTGNLLLPVPVFNLSAVARISSGTVHTCAVTPTGNVVCWGSGLYGKLGYSGTEQQNTAVTVSGINNAFDVSSSGGHVCAVLRTGVVMCWGLGTSGQLGNGNNANWNVPVAVSGITDAVQVSCGGSHSCAVISTGRIMCWGRGQEGQLGNGGTADQLSPVSVSGITNAIQASAGTQHSCALLVSGSIQCWGSGTFGQLGTGGTSQSLSPASVAGITDAVMISPKSALNTCALLGSGGVRCWGINDNGQIGNGGTTQQNSPVTVTGISNAVFVSSGRNHACAVLLTGEFRCWGRGQEGQLGNGLTAQQLTQVAVIMPPQNYVDPGPVMEVSPGAMSNHFCSLTFDNRMKCWGLNGQGQLGIGTTTSMGDSINTVGNYLTYINPGSSLSIVQVVSGNQHTCVLLNNSNIKCWGSNMFIGIGSASGTTLTPPVSAVSLGTGITAKYIASSSRHTCAILHNNLLKCWGTNDYGELGLGHANTIGDGASEMGDSLPHVSLGTGRTAKMVWTGKDSTCTILDNSELKCWGRADSGQLGLVSQRNPLGDNANEMGDNLPVVRLGTGRYAVQVGIGGSFACVVLDNGLLKCFGDNTHGQLGYGNTGTRYDAENVPYVDIGTSRTVKKVSVGGAHVCVILDNDLVKCWGDNTNGILGYGHTNKIGDNANEMGNDLPYVDIGTGRLAKDITVGSSSTCVLLYASASKTQELKCWGAGIGRGTGSSATIGDGPGEMGDALVSVDIGLASPEPTKCPPGSYRIFESNACAICPAGSANNEPAKTSCTVCLPGSFTTSSNSSTCTLCQAGSFSTVAGANTSSVCQSCPAGTSSNPGSTTCTSCLPGSYSIAPSSTTCTLCVAGTFSTSTGATSISSCQPCALGTYSSAAGRTNCTLCPPGGYSAFVGESSPLCTQCLPGKFSNATGANSSSTCTSCTRGSYSTQPSSISCTLCLKGSYSDLLGAFMNTTCVKCPGGTYSTQDGSSTCTSCMPGKFSSVTGATNDTVCSTCPMGQASTL